MIGNLISNTVIVVVSFSVSPLVALASLANLVVIHKLEYFVNARIIGTRIKARAWELLLAMLVMDVWFGIPGLNHRPRSITRTSRTNWRCGGTSEAVNS